MPLIEAKPIEKVFTREPRCQPISAKGQNMAESDRTKYLRIALRLVGLTFIAGIYTLTIIWPSGWSWHTGHIPHYLQMILSIYATLGVFLLVASRKPLAHLSLIWFTVWSSVVHAAVMAVQSLTNPEHMGHLGGDVLGLFVVAVVLALLTPRGAAAQARYLAIRREVSNTKWELIEPILRRKHRHDGRGRPWQHDSLVRAFEEGLQRKASRRGERALTLSRIISFGW